MARLLPSVKTASFNGSRSRFLSQLVQETSQVIDSPMDAVCFRIRESETTDKAQGDVLSSLGISDFAMPRSGARRRQRNFAPSDAPSQFFRHKTCTDRAAKFAIAAFGNHSGIVCP